MKWHFRFLFYIFLISSTDSYASNIKVITCKIYESIADHLLITPDARIDPNEIKDGDIIYLDPNFRHHFIAIAPYIRSSYILITADSDIPAPGDYGYYFLDDPKLIAWFAINIENSTHPKLHHLPLGTSSNPHYAYDKTADRIYTGKNEFPKKHLLYLNFTICTHLQERQRVFDLFSTKNFCYLATFKNFEEYLIDLASSKFVLSPRGNGLDCFRTWEALYSRTIPIVHSSSLNPLYEDLPVLIVEDWEEITEEFLDKKYEEMQLGTYCWEKLDPDYWVQKIISCQDDFRKNIN